MSVVDASALVSALSGGEHAGWVERQLADGAGHALWAPHLSDAEVGHALRRLVGAGALQDGDATAALHDLAGLPLRRIVHGGLLARAWQLRESVSFYDGLYLALAEQLGAPLLTLDGRFARAARAASTVGVLTPPEGPR